MPSSAVAPESVRSLSAAMRQDSSDQHDAAEQSSFVTELLNGRVNEQGYIDYLLRLREIYRALEDAVRKHQNDPLVSAVYDPALERLDAIDADLAHWAPGADLEVDSAAVRAYCARFADAAWGGALVAHHYTRYLGDLSGGQAIGRILDRTFDMNGEGLAFYKFPMRAKPYKDAYRAALDGLDLDDSEINRVVDEVKLAFSLNQNLFHELAQNLPAYQR
ncbi:biliverdin-producing heme oxygenase [Mycobacterium sp. TNTM28]|uniref:heme oxygenase (biliverdin-producing) n=1 Tax=[Mycobacterium] fortunisiensis TaxID=2600579 RepID=A0ABS6KMB0_9MYCO|nr:biliverdin-producing heme oxygenase [[Mycobacterium] fortunisiensis]MBU9764737.1 biliverdin-producing heme oxygenase [[Mycobacterium] fortunisiensis]